MSGKSDIKKVLLHFGKTDPEAYATICTVDSVNLTDKTCYCIPLDGRADISDVALIADKKTGFMVVPKVGSLVFVVMQNKATGFIAMCSEVDSIELNGSNFSGLIKIDELIKKLNDLETFCNNVVAVNVAIQAAAVSSPATPVTNATLAGFTTGIGNIPLSLTLKPQLENTTVKHGDGN